MPGTIGRTRKVAGGSERSSGSGSRPVRSTPKIPRASSLAPRPSPLAPRPSRQCWSAPIASATVRCIRKLFAISKGTKERTRPCFVC
ncbi:MAG: hypothetical protein EXS05_00540 [Planctomycetaceae bacterium]|nr:hypothetical protein [Planctomycetaceae bacterium]